MLSGVCERHDLLRVTVNGWRATLAATAGFHHLTQEPRNLVDGWAGRGWPLIVRRPADGENVDGIAVGLSLPPSLGKLRLGFAVPMEMVAERLPAVPLSEALGSAPDLLRPQLEAVVALGDLLSASPAVFGALLWQHLTGLAYLHPGSDIDLLWPNVRRNRLPALLDGLKEIDAIGPTRLDGEILMTADGGVNWRELHRELRQPGGSVLVKSMKGAELRCPHMLFA